MTSFWQQLKALLWRNILLKKRNKPQLFQELFFPVYFVAILAVIKITTKPEKQPAMSFPVNNVTDFGLYSFVGKTIYVSPNTNEINSRMQAILLGLPHPINYELFATQEEAETKYKLNSSQVAAGIIFNYDDIHYSYAIRMNFNSIPGTKNIFNDNSGSCRSDKSGKAISGCSVNSYMFTGFTMLQLAIDKVLMKELNVNTTSPAVAVQLMDKSEFSPNTNYIQTLSSIYFVFSFSVLANYLAVNIVAEKEKKIKEGMLMMGLKGSVFWLSWTLIYITMVTVASGIMILIIVATKFFSQSNMFLLFLTFLLYGCSFIAFAFMITPFFKKARVAGVVVGFSTVIISCVHLAVSQTRDTGSYDANIPVFAQWLMCLFSPIAFSTIIDQGIFLDVQLTGFGFDSSLKYGKFPLYAPILMLILDTVLYAVLTIYFDHVVPGEYGVRYKPLYFLQYSYWFRSKPNDEMKRLTSNKSNFSPTGDVEAVSRELEEKVAMRISHLTKTFKQNDKNFNAVDGFCLDIYDSHITCLLGHNGAGKTTLMNMLTGVIPPTSGTAKILHLDINDSSDLEEIRSHCGICPQHNILYDTLSCEEHLEMFANIKGVLPELIKKKVEGALQDVDLTSQADTLAKDLSGGQKRKLSVAIALIGDPKLIFLDEPTAGMDPYSRRHLWSLLKKKKEGRVVLLTTHFMDEADILADRKAFMSKGKLRCCGSSLFLKNKFGIGYHLTMVINPECEIEKVTELLQSKISDIKLQRSYGKELSYIIPLKDVSQFSTLFSDLDEQSKTLGINNYGVSMTTLEEVFLKLESEEVNDNESGQADNDINVTFSANCESSSIDPPSLIQTLSPFSQSVVKGRNLSKQRFKNLLKIRYLLVRRNLQALIFQIFVPIIFVVMGLVLAKVNRAAPAEYPRPLEINPQLYVALSNTSSELLPLLAFDAMNTTDSTKLITEWKHHYKVDTYKAGTNTSGQVAPHYMGIQVQNITGQNFNKFVILYNDSAIHSVPAVINLFTQTILSLFNAAKSIKVINLPWPQIDSVILFNSGAMMAPLLVGLAFMLIIPGFAADIVQDREWKLRGQLRISGVTFNEYWASIYASDVILYMIPSVLVLIIVLAMQIDGLSSPGAVGSLVLLFVINMPFYIVLALVLSFIFDKTESCISYLPQILTIVAMLPYITVSLVDMLSGSNAAIIIHYVACILDPPYIMFGGFYFISRINLVAVQSRSEANAVDYFRWNNHFLITIIMPVIHFIWMYWLLRVLDIQKTGGKIQEAFPCISNSEVSSDIKNSDIVDNEDDDVKAERTHIENLHSFDNPSYSRKASNSLSETKPPVAYTQQLRKVYHKRTKKAKCFQNNHVKSKVAVKNLSFGVNEGEVIGLLGPNGAGKTTALNMIIAETEPTCGRVIVSGCNVRSHMLSVLEFLGYCPQHDALWENITLEEHIRCFAAIKGVDPKHLDAIVDFYVSSLKLHEHKKKLAKKLSGGTKRKLSYIISILGSPHLVLLDEPSTGMDPQSKRFLWDTISASFKKTNKGAILTTHYMEEADALCDRVGIMVNGQLVCLGSTQHLKSKFGSGYILEVKLRCRESSLIESLMDRLEEHLNTVFTGLDKVERFLERAQYALPREAVKSLGETFAILEKCKETHSLEEYSFSQSTLEQVFLHFAKKQLDEEDDAGQNSNYNILANV